jgi:hypothetical protein
VLDPTEIRRLLAHDPCPSASRAARHPTPVARSRSAASTWLARLRPLSVFAACHRVEWHLSYAVAFVSFPFKKNREDTRLFRHGFSSPSRCCTTPKCHLRWHQLSGVVHDAWCVLTVCGCGDISLVTLLALLPGSSCRAYHRGGWCSTF